MYIVLEGPDGSGKTTHADRLVARFRESGVDPFLLEEPSRLTPFGKLLREILASGAYQRSHAALFLADRQALQEEFIPAALDAGRPVVSSRNFISTLVYQQEQYPLSWLLDIHATLPVKPTHVFFLDVEPEDGLARVATRSSTIEVYEKLDTQRRIRQRYLDIFEDPRLSPLLADGHKKYLIRTGRPDGVSTIEENAERIWSLVR